MLFETTIAELNDNCTVRAEHHWFSETIPDLCAIAATLARPFEITVYAEESEPWWIIEQHDEPGDKGNYGGFWHTTQHYPGGLPDYMQP